MTGRIVVGSMEAATACCIPSNVATSLSASTTTSARIGEESEHRTCAIKHA